MQERQTSRGRHCVQRYLLFAERAQTPVPDTGRGDRQAHRRDCEKPVEIHLVG
jgi:hypothetical protein